LGGDKTLLIMASAHSSDLAIELITTGENAGLWGTITNTNLQVLELASSGVVSIPMGGNADVTLTLADGSAAGTTTATGKNLYIKLTGTLTRNQTLIMPQSVPSGGTALRVFIVEDTTVRANNNFTINVKTANSTAPVAVPAKSTGVFYSNGTNTVRSILNKGYYEVVAGTNSNYLAVAGDQILLNTFQNAVTITLPTSPVQGDEVTIIDANTSPQGFGNNNCVVGRNGNNILSTAADLTLTTNTQAITLVYVNTPLGWTYKTNSA